ncbi:DUF5719 family protein [Pseudofrankia sp. BMG5.36]|uniref:DUF5719 family protein n=1 Tax=Pseudofrankia sp. BMG5.36 TaxID=1834512 RepID=UPI0008D9BBE3|nr:DUF5719 family protein [Pseudofrankia sp. BMG5.36]OHV49442.1 hypothetical protein BCD48_01260 [Pseudofrankia sp. BMG5.36]
MSDDRARRRRWGPVPAAVTASVAGMAVIATAAVLVPDKLPMLAPPGEPVAAETAYRVGAPPSSRALVCPDLGSAGRAPTRIDIARSDTRGQVAAALVAGDGGGAAPGGEDGGSPDQAAGEEAAGSGAAGTDGPSAWHPPATAVLRGDARRGHLEVPGAQPPPVAAPRPAPSDLSGLASLAPDTRQALSALKSEADAKALAALAALPPGEQAGLARLAAAPAPQPPPGLAALAGLSAADQAGLMRLEVSSGRPVALRGSTVANLSATVTAPGGPAGPVRDLCGPSAGWAWFAGPATGAGHDPFLFLANLGSAPARLAVHALAPGRAPTVTEVVVPPGETTGQRLAAVAPEAAAAVVGVEVRAGRVSSWLVDRPSDGGAWDLAPVPGTAAPARAVLVGPVLAPPGAGGAAAELVVAAPATDARVRVRLVTASGRPTSPAGLDAVAVPGGEATSIPLTLPRGESVGVLVETAGPAPVVAGLRLPSGAPDGGRAADGTAAGAGADGGVWVAGTPVPADGQAPGVAASATARSSLADHSLVPYLDVPPIPPGTAGALLLAAPAGPATARLDGHAVMVPGGGAVAVALPAGYSGGTLSVSGGPVGVTELLGKPAGPPSGGDAADGQPSADGPRLRTVSSVLPLIPADPVGPAVLVADPSAAR